ncbi:hypothetical protein X874_15690 [Mannheimia varigena USDA-ARS-USMARC-1312]|nr:hypothetical protein X874_15690 [Mannheimia varigena USDA-ARS-USMARC-1312]
MQIFSKKSFTISLPLAKPMFKKRCFFVTACYLIKTFFKLTPNLSKF